MDGKVDCLVAGVGTGGTITGTGPLPQGAQPGLPRRRRRAAVVAACSRGGDARPAQDPGHRRGLRPAGARPRRGRRDHPRRRRGRARDRAPDAPAARACCAASRAARRCGRRLQVAARARGAPASGSPSSCRTPASATSRRRSSRPRPSRSAAELDITRAALPADVGADEADAGARWRRGRSWSVRCPPGEALENVPRSAREAGHAVTVDGDVVRIVRR